MPSETLANFAAVKKLLTQVKKDFKKEDNVVFSFVIPTNLVEKIVPYIHSSFPSVPFRYIALHDYDFEGKEAVTRVLVELDREKSKEEGKPSFVSVQQYLIEKSTEIVTEVFRNEIKRITALFGEGEEEGKVMEEEGKEEGIKENKEGQEEGVEVKGKEDEDEGEIEEEGKEEEGEKKEDWVEIWFEMVKWNVECEYRQAATILYGLFTSHFGADRVFFTGFDEKKGHLSGFVSKTPLPEENKEAKEFWDKMRRLWKEVIEESKEGEIGE